MELRESIEEINSKLISEFGREWNGQARWRVVFSDDQFEKRITEYTDGGIKLLIPEVRELPKYRQYIQGKYLLERLVPVPQPSDLIEKISYECAWTFEDKNGNYLPPIYEACKFVIEAVYSAMDSAGKHTKYKDNTKSPEELRKQIDDIEKELAIDEKLTDALHYGFGVTNPLDSTKVDTNSVIKAENIGYSEPKEQSNG